MTPQPSHRKAAREASMNPLPPPYKNVVKNGLVHRVQVGVQHRAGSVSYEAYCETVVFFKPPYDRTTDDPVTCLKCIAKGEIHDQEDDKPEEEAVAWPRR